MTDSPLARLSPADKTIDVRVFVDNVMAEVYFQNGRVAMTAPAFCRSETCGMAVGASAGGASLMSATAWAVEIGLGRIVALHHRSSTLFHTNVFAYIIIRYLFF
jgi:hypothetical protein